MAGSFQVGSITAKFILDDSDAGQQFKSLISKATSAASQIKVALGDALKPLEKPDRIDLLGSSAGRAVAETKKIGREILAEFDVVADGVKARGGFVGSGALIPVTPIRDGLRRVTTEIRRVAREVSVKLIGAFKNLGRQALITSRRIIRSFGRGVVNVFRRLRRAVFGIQGALAAIGVGFGALGLINRAREVESVGAAFENLTRSIGGTADSFLGKLRKATKDTVADLDLMRIANNAVLLTAATSEDQFATLAETARRLGRAVGRDTVEAINDLTLGIGRQSRLILDNLGLVVRVGDANEDYARKVNKTVEQLNVQERQQAFVIAAMDAARTKVRELGPDIDTLNDAWGRFTAQISNTANVIATAFVGSGPFNAISDFLQESRSQIAAYANFISRAVVSIARAVTTTVTKLFQDISSTGIIRTISDSLSTIFGFVSRITFALLQNLFNEMLAPIGKLVAAMFTALGVSVTKGVTNLFIDAIAAAKTAAVLVGASIPGLATLLGLDDPQSLATALRKIEDAQAEASGDLETKAKKAQENLAKIADDAAKEVAESAARTATKVADEIISEAQRAGDGATAVGEGIEEAIGGIRNAVRRLNLDKADPFAGFRPLIVQREVAGLADTFNQLVLTRKQLIDQSPELVDIDDVSRSGDELLRIKEAVVAASDAFVELKNAPIGAADELTNNFVIAVDSARTALARGVGVIADFGIEAIRTNAEVETAAGGMQTFTDRLAALGRLAFRDFPVAEAIDDATKPIFLASEELTDMLKPFRKRENVLEIEARTIGLEESAAELLKFDEAFKLVKDQLSPEDTARLDNARATLEKLLQQRDNAKQSEVAAKAIDALDKQLGQLQDTITGIEVGDLAVKFDQLGRALEEAVSEAPADKAATIRDQFRRMGEALVDAEIAKVAKELRDLDTELANVNSTAAATRIEELEAGFNEFAAALKRSGIEAGSANDLLQRMRRSVDDLQDRTAFADLDDTLREMRERVQDARIELELMSKTDLEQVIFGINEQYGEMIDAATLATRALIDQRIAAGATEEEIAELTERLDEFQTQASVSRRVEIAVANNAALRENAREVAALFTDPIRDSLSGAISDAIKSGEGPAKIFAQVTASFMDSSIRKAVESIAGFLQEKLTAIFAESAGALGLGGVASGLLGLGAAIFQNINNRSSSAIDDFDNAVNSSEAVRGVVAGPTNVAIAKIGDNLKQAMRTTELLLEQILQTMQSAQPGGGTPGSGSVDGALQLSTSSPS